MIAREIQNTTRIHTCKQSHVVHVLLGDLCVRSPAAPKGYSLVHRHSLRSGRDHTGVVRAVLSRLHGAEGVTRLVFEIGQI